MATQQTVYLNIDEIRSLLEFIKEHPNEKYFAINQIPTGGMCLTTSIELRDNSAIRKNITAYEYW